MVSSGISSKPREQSTKQWAGSSDIGLTTAQSFCVTNGVSLFGALTNSLFVLFIRCVPCRFAYSSSISQLPQWLRPHVQTYDRFGLVQRDVRAFFKEAQKDVSY